MIDQLIHINDFLLYWRYVTSICSRSWLQSDSRMKFDKAILALSFGSHLIGLKMKSSDRFKLLRGVTNRYRSRGSRWKQRILIISLQDRWSFCQEGSDICEFSNSKTLSGFRIKLQRHFYIRISQNSVY